MGLRLWIASLRLQVLVWAQVASGRSEFIGEARRSSRV